MGELLDSLNIIEIIFEGLGQIKYVFDVFFIIALIPALIGAAKRSIYKTLFKFVFYGAVFAIAIINIDTFADMFGNSALQSVGLSLKLEYNGATEEFTNLFDYFNHLYSYDTSLSPAYIEALTLATIRNLTWIILFPVLSLASYIASTIVWVIIMIFFPRALRKKIRSAKVRALNLPLAAVFSLVLGLLMIAPYVNLSNALKGVVIDPDSPIAFISPSFAGVFAWFTPEKSFILNLLDKINIPQLFVFFDTFTVDNGGTTETLKFAEELHTVINTIGSIVPATV